MESRSQPDVAGRVAMAIHIIAFYWISIRMVFRKRLSKLVIILIVLPCTAVFTYLVLLSVKPP